MSSDQPIELWSEAMYGLLERLARCFWRRWFVEPDDLYQEACLAMAEWARDRGDSPMDESLIARIARNRMRKYIRKFHRLGRQIQMSDIVEPPDDDPQIDLKLDLDEAMAAIEPRHADDLVKHYIEYRSFAELAAARGVTEKAARSRAGYARGLLRGGLEAYSPPEHRHRSSPNVRRLFTSGRGVDWSKWGRIPNQRTDDY